MIRVVLAFGVWVACCEIFLACAVTPAQHTANLSESAQYAAELAQCRESAKLDGGWPAYEVCACHVDAQHGLDASAGCP